MSYHLYGRYPETYNLARRCYSPLFSEIMRDFRVISFSRRKFAHLFVVLLTLSILILLVHWSRIRWRATIHTDEYKPADIGTFVQITHPRWPPLMPSELIDSSTGLHDLALRPLIAPSSANRNSSDSYYRLLKSMYSGKAINGSLLKQTVLLDKALRLGSSTADYNLYPQVLDLNRAVNALKSAMPVDEAPINDPTLLVIQSPKSICNYSRPRANTSQTEYPLDLVVLIKSCVDCINRRVLARSTYMQPHLWGGFRVQFAFVVGLPCIQLSEQFHFDGVNVTTHLKRITSKTKLKEAYQNLFDESKTYQDLLIGGFHDTYYNLTLKLVFAFRWASVFCDGQTPLFLFLDDDMSIIPMNLIRLVRQIPQQYRANFNGGFPLADRRVLRPKPDARKNRYAVSEDEFPWDMHPPYSSGAASMIGAQMVCDAAIAMAFTKFYRIDDVYLGIVWNKLDYPTMKISSFRLNMKENQFNDTVIVPRSKLDRYIDWNSGKAVKITTTSRTTQA